MSASSVPHRLTWAIATSALFLGVPGLRAQDAELSESVRAVLTGYAALDPLAVTWSETTEAAPLGREKIATEVLGRITNRGGIQQLAFSDRRMYLRRESGDKQAETVEIAFNRNVLFVGDPAKASKNPKVRPTLIKWVPEKDLPEAGYFSNEYFRAAGVRLPSRVRDLVQTWRPQSELLALLAEGGRVDVTGPAELDGRPLLRVQVAAPDLSRQMPPIDLAGMEERLRAAGSMSEKEIKRRLAEARSLQGQPPLRRFDFYFDPARGYAVRRLDTRDKAGRLLTRSDCTEHEQLTGREVWLPRRCRVEKYTFVGLRDQVFASPLYLNQYLVTAFDVQPWPDDRFTLNYTTPGTYVNDGTFPEVEGKSGVIYHMPANPEQLDKVVAAARAKSQARANATKMISPLRLVLLVVNGVLLTGLAIYIVARRWKARST